eukprot:gene10703-22344_t
MSELLHESRYRILSASPPKDDGPVNDGAKNTAEAKKPESNALMDSDDYDDYEEPKTAGQKVAFYSVVATRLLLMALGLVCVGFTVRELFPGRMAPNTLFNEAFEFVRNNDEITFIVGDNIRAYGRDVGRNTEGRRNIVDSRTYTDDDGSKRTRVRFHIQGTKGKMAVYAEVSNRMAHNEYVYLICQDSHNGRVITIHDNRARLAMESTMTTSEGKDAMSTLLGSFSGKK